MGEGELEIAVAIFRPLVPGAAAGVPRARHEPATRDEVAGAREALDAVDLEPDSEGHDAADAGEPEEPLDVGCWNEHRVQLSSELLGLRTEQGQLLLEELNAQLHERGQRGGRGDVVLREEAGDRVPDADLLRYELQASAEQFAGFPPFGTDPVGFRHQIATE